MTEKRFTLSQNGTFHTVKDNVENKPLGVFEFKDDEFPVYACFHRIIDLMNNLSDENEQLKEALIELREIGDYQYERIKELFDENEQLESEVAYYKLMLESLQQYAKNFVEKHNKKGYKTIEKEKDCGHCKNLQIDGMFGMWCEKDRDWTNTDAKYCPDYKR